MSWLALAIGFVVVCSAMVIAGHRKYADALDKLGKVRPSPTADEFERMLATDCEPDIAEFLWRELKVYWEPGLTPHPEDDFNIDLPIDTDEPDDWVRDFCKENGLRMRDLPQWPKEMSTTVRNLARWLSQGRAVQQGH